MHDPSVPRSAVQHSCHCTSRPLSLLLFRGLRPPHGQLKIVSLGLGALSHHHSTSFQRSRWQGLTIRKGQPAAPFDQPARSACQVSLPGQPGCRPQSTSLQRPHCRGLTIRKLPLPVLRQGQPAAPFGQPSRSACQVSVPGQPGCLPGQPAMAADDAASTRGEGLGLYGLALVGAAEEVALAKSLWQKIVKAVCLALIFLQEVLSLVTLAPYGVYAMWTQRKLQKQSASRQPAARQQSASCPPAVSQKSASSQGRHTSSSAPLAEDARTERQREALQSEEARASPSGSSMDPLLDFSGHEHRPRLMQDVRYGPKPRNLVDIYFPPASQSGSKTDARPVVLFVHGGVWASGERWQFAPMASALAEEGAIAVVASYTLFPQALAPEQAEEVSLCLSWLMDSAEGLGGDPGRVSLMGHSSGAHICALALWRRMRAAAEGKGDVRQPACFLGLSGVYDIGVHWRHELKRGRAYLSTMRRAMGGDGNFGACSPALLFAALADARNKGDTQAPSDEDDLTTSSVPGFPRGHLLDGVAPFGRGSARDQLPLPDLLSTSSLTTWTRHVPPMALMVSHEDFVAPPETSFALKQALEQAGVTNCEVLHYQSVTHLDFVVWEKSRWGDRRSSVRAKHVQDIFDIVLSSSPQELLLQKRKS